MRPRRRPARTTPRTPTQLPAGRHHDTGDRRRLSVPCQDTHGCGAAAGREPGLLLLDGRQRLTSLFQAVYVADAPVKTVDSRGKPVRRCYYVDTAKPTGSPSDRDESIVSVPEDRILRTDFGRKVVHDLSDTSGECGAGLFPLRIVFDTQRVARRGGAAAAPPAGAPRAAPGRPPAGRLGDPVRRRPARGGRAGRRRTGRQRGAARARVRPGLPSAPLRDRSRRYRGPDRGLRHPRRTHTAPPKIASRGGPRGRRGLVIVAGPASRRGWLARSEGPGRAVWAEYAATPPA